MVELQIVFISILFGFLFVIAERVRGCTTKSELFFSFCFGVAVMVFIIIVTSLITTSNIFQEKDVVKSPSSQLTQMF